MFVKNATRRLPAARINAGRTFNPGTMVAPAAVSQLQVVHTASCGGSVLKKELPSLDVDLYIGVATPNPLVTSKPGNGGMRLMKYRDCRSAVDEALALAKGMAVKHDIFNTGFAGIKLVAHAKSGVASVDKPALLSETAKVLNAMKGVVYTGCDINTSPGDMHNLSTQTPYVLAAIGNEAVDPNMATAFGVVGAIEAVVEHTFEGTMCADEVYFVHGVGAVGSVVALELVRRGCKVYVADHYSGRAASVDGAIDISNAVQKAGEGWAECVPSDVTVLVPCSCSHLLTSRAVAQLGQVKAIVGATNLPFATPEAQQAFGGLFIPEGISSAGAVIVDSLEHSDPASFAAAKPIAVYNFTRNIVCDKVMQATRLAVSLDAPVASLLDKVQAPDTEPLGQAFSSFAQSMRTSLHEPKLVHTSGRSKALAMPQLRPRHAKQQHCHFATASRAQQVTDVCIVGAGIMGLSIAFQLKRRCPEMSVVVLESAPGLGYGSSGYSTGFLRAFYSFDETMRLALSGINAYKNWGEYTGLGSKAEGYFTETGALWMLGKTKQENEVMLDRLAKFGVSSEVMGKDDIAARYPVMNTDPFPEYDDEGELLDKDYGPLSALLEHGCGHMDSSACLRDMLAACTKAGVDVRFKAHVSEIRKGAGQTVEGVRLKSGDTLTAGHIINCAGPWFEKLNAPLGVTTSTTMEPIRIQVGHKQLPDDEAFLGLPFVADMYGPSGVYFMPRRANKQLVFGSIAHRFESEVVDPDDYNTALDPDFKQDYLNCLFHRLPTLPTAGEIVGFSSMYTVNQDDVHPVIGPIKEYSNMSLVTGFSGHGFKLAPAVGSLVAQQLTDSHQTMDTFETDIPQDFMDPHREPLHLKLKTHFA